tara:strand:- start:2795 stop:4918 length:2124 start_codon:yes stop_codon:yes gene_type:complete
MKSIKILLGDPRHNTVGAHSYFVPIGIGYIGSNLLEKFKNSKIELKLCVDPEEIFTLLDEWKPDIIGISNYIWNSNISNFICEYAKKKNPNTLCILGGPEFPAGTGARKIEDSVEDQTYTKCLEYLSERSSVDYFAYSDGEVAFVEIVRKFIENNNSLKSMKDKDEPMKGCVSLTKKKDKIHVGEYIPRIGMEGSVKNEGRDEIPSPYTTGLLDKFLNGIFVPAFETARGCPFLCTFCDQGLDQTKITTFSVKRMAEEITYVGEKLSKLKKGTKTISIFDSNWGIFEKDVRLADEILTVMEKYDWPQYIECLTPKSNWDNLIKINDKLKNRVALDLSMQSLNIEVLTDIKRRNWTAEQYLLFINENRKRGKSASSEMIIPLPNETEESYFHGIKFLMDNHVQANTYSLMMLCGAELGRDRAIKKYSMVPKFRILPKSFGEYRNKKIVEIESICVSTNTMSYQNYLNCRNYSFIVKLLGHPVFIPIDKLTKKLGIGWYDFSKRLTSVIQDENFKGKFKDLYNEFCKESHEELFNTKKEAIDFYQKPENYESLVRGDIGENLMSKYTGKGLLILEDIITTIFYVIRKIIRKDYSKELNIVLDSSEKWLKNLYLIDTIFSDSDLIKNNKNKLKINFDFPEWLQNSKLPFENFKRDSTYEFKLDHKKIDYIRNEIKSITLGGMDERRAFSRYLERRMSEHNFLKKEFEKVI